MPILEMIISVVILVGLASFVVWAIRNRPSSRQEPRSLDPVTERANAEAHAYANRNGTGPGAPSI